MALRIVIPCNDYRNGQFEGRAEAMTIEDVEMVGGSVCIAYFERPMRTVNRRIDGPYTLRIGRILLPHWHHESWYGNWCCEAFSVTWVYALKAINYLAKCGWHVEEGPHSICEAVRLRKVVTPKEWTERHGPLTGDSPD